jgi:Dolichyl-phosphate-mannose-protein mannosyltransferase
MRYAPCESPTNRRHKLIFVAAWGSNTDYAVAPGRPRPEVGLNDHHRLAMNHEKAHLRALPVATETKGADKTELCIPLAATLPQPQRWTISPMVFVFAIAALALHFLGRDRYGFFRDELYYIACGNHLAFGYVDQPPLIAVIARLSSFLLGTTLSGFRFFPALAGGCLVLLTGWMTRELGGGRFAQALASLAVLLAPIYLAFGSFLSMNAFEPVLWMACACVLVRILKGGDERLWLLFCIVAGIGLENKHTMLMFGFAVVTGLILSRDWKRLRSKWLWLGGALAFVLFLPNLIWEAQHNWPQIEVVRNAQRLKNTPIGAGRFMGEQILFFNPVALPIIAAGLGWVLFSRREKRLQAIGWAYLVVITVVITLHGKTYYPVPFYSILLASGSVAVERFLEDKKRLRLTYVALLAVSGLIMLPFGVPILPFEELLRYQSVISLNGVVKMERDPTGEVHQLYGDMLGWENMVETVAGVYNRLPPSDQKHCAILAGNYGEAGAIDLLGGKLGLPKAISAHNNYYLWGTHDHTGEVVILFGQGAESTKTLFSSVERVATISNRHAVAAENNLPVYVCRKPKAPLAELWPSLRYFE